MNPSPERIDPEKTIAVKIAKVAGTVVFSLMIGTIAVATLSAVGNCLGSIEEKIAEKL